MKPLPACQAKPILRAYESLTRESWFNRNAITERELLKMLFALRGDGSGPEDAFYKAAEDEAKRRFSKMR
jgi:hypothetical protein